MRSDPSWPSHSSTKLPGKRASEEAREKKKIRRGEKRYAEKQRILRLLEEHLRAKSEEEAISVETAEHDDTEILILDTNEFTEEELCATQT